MAYNKETKMYEGYIYCITNQINGKQYIGQTTRTIEKRWREHIKKHGGEFSYIDNSIFKHGYENFSLEEIDYCKLESQELLKEKLNYLEIMYIENFGSLVPNGYNLTKGGSYGSINNEKAVIKYDLSGNILQKYNSVKDAADKNGINIADISHCCNKKRSVVVGGYMWSFDGDIYRTDTYIKNRNVFIYDLDGNYIGLINCLKDIDDKKFRHRVQNCCSGYTYNVDGYVYRYTGDAFDKYNIKPKRTGGHTKQKCPVVQISMKGDFINMFHTLKDASIIIGINVDGITKCCKHRIDSYKGYKFIYKEEYLNNGGLLCN